ncbi:3-oxoacyl-[acyl-carrier-protein] reductase FabG-like Protein [Elysia marginata]|uniref:3-oxoacyl-[acyl-carrier-protein] reductase FabG-like Protein n=1 Tax=Elysia marginata TaxID=1093978 RepID=A0AAV4H8E9_9GAST|nr:3-oxoacyl-[acyl-carrier-protein] reductase FabG-like Protein [Elysia marginata]
MSDFAGKSVIVTGSSSGIGECTALMFARRGANVTVCGRDESRVHHVLQACITASKHAGYAKECIGVTGDMTIAAHREDVLEKTVAAFGKLDVLVANHGIMPAFPDLDSVTEETYDKIMSINTKSVLFIIKAAAKHLEASQGCVVVNSSIGSTSTVKEALPYLMSKAALDHMVRSVALTLAPKGIRVNAINPTLVITKLFRDQAENIESTEFGQFIAKSHPLHGRASEPEEQAEVVLFLASSAARFITGECVRVDGGISLKGMPSNYFNSNL